MTQQAKFKSNEIIYIEYSSNAFSALPDFNYGIFPTFHAMRLATLGFESNVFLQTHRQE
jgi:hypothetical protein